MTLPLQQPNTSPVWVVQQPGVGSDIAAGIQQFGQNYLASQQQAAQQEAQAERIRAERELGEFLRALLVGEPTAAPSSQMGGTQPVPDRTAGGQPRGPSLVEDRESAIDRLPPTITPTVPQAGSEGPKASPGAPNPIGMEERFWAGIRKLDPRLIGKAVEMAAPFLTAERKRMADLTTAEQERILNQLLPDVRSGKLSVADALAQTPPHLRDEAAKLYGEAGKGKLEETKASQTDDTREYEFYTKQEKEAGRTPLSFLDWQTKKRKSGASSVSVTLPPGDKELTGAGNEEFIKGLLGARSGIRRVMARGGTIRETIGNVRNMFTGPFAEQFRDIARATGIGKKKIVATETYAQQAAQEVVDLLQTGALGRTQISDADRKFMEQAAAKDITFNRGSIAQILAINLRLKRQGLEDFASDVEAALGSPVFAASAAGRALKADAAAAKKRLVDYDNGLLEIEEFLTGDNAAEGRYRGYDTEPVR